MSFAYFGGIDFSGAKEPLSNLWSAVGRPEGGKLEILAVRPHPFRADLASYVVEGWREAASAGNGATILWGADFPFGLPAQAAREIGGEGIDWVRLGAWVADRPADEVRGAVPDATRAPRLTDTAGALAPLDLRLYKQTVEGMRWLHELRETADVSIIPQAPVSGSSTALVEVYPSATVVDLGLPRRRAPARPGEIRARAAALRTFLRFASPGDEAIAVTLEDAWDAVIAALSAFLAHQDLDQPFRTGNRPRDVIQLEGWIYRPPAALQ